MEIDDHLTCVTPKRPNACTGKNRSNSGNQANRRAP